MSGVLPLRNAPASVSRSAAATLGTRDLRPPVPPRAPATRPRRRRQRRERCRLLLEGSGPVRRGGRLLRRNLRRQPARARALAASSAAHGPGRPLPEGGVGPRRARARCALQRRGVPPAVVVRRGEPLTGRGTRSSQPRRSSARRRHRPVRRLLARSKPREVVRLKARADLTVSGRAGGTRSCRTNSGGRSVREVAGNNPATSRMPEARSSARRACRTQPLEARDARGLAPPLERRQLSAPLLTGLGRSGTPDGSSL